MLAAVAVMLLKEVPKHKTFVRVPPNRENAPQTTRGGGGSVRAAGLAENIL